jgi:hypothetical protein
MTGIRTAVATSLAVALMLSADATFFDQGAQGQQRQHARAPAQPSMPMQPGMMGQGAWHTGPHMMSPDEMHDMMKQMGGMMGHGIDQGMPMPRGMMSQATGPGMMDPPMGSGVGGWSGLEGRRVVPLMRLSTDDVRGFLQRHLEALGNERLKVGKVEALDDDTITADIVTVDDSLVERFAVDRHTGLISAAS